MTIRFKRTLPDHAHMYHGEELVGELTRQPDCLNPGLLVLLCNPPVQ